MDAVLFRSQQGKYFVASHVSSLPFVPRSCQVGKVFYLLEIRLFLMQIKHLLLLPAPFFLLIIFLMGNGSPFSKIWHLPSMLVELFQ